MTIHDDAETARRKVYDDQTTALNTQLSAVQAQCTTLTASLSAANATISQRDGTIAALNTQVAALTANCAALESEVTELVAEIAALEAQLGPRTIWDIDFADWPLGAIDAQRFADTFNVPVYAASAFQYCSIVTDTDGVKAFQVKLPANQYNVGSTFVCPLPEKVDDATFETEFRLVAGFQTGRYVKIPGLGGAITGSPPTGGGSPTNGFSARHQAEYLNAYAYVYHPDQDGTYGDFESMGRAYVVGQVHKHVTRTKMNTVGQLDGILNATLDGQPGVARTDYRFRDDVRVQNSHLLLSCFRGGAAESATSQDGFVRFRRFKVTTPR